MLSIALLVIVCLANFVLGLFVIANNSRARLNRLFTALTFALSAWSLVSFLEDVGLSHTVIRFLIMTDFGLASLMLALFFWLCYELTQSKPLILLRTVQAMAVISIILPVTGQAVKLQFLPHRVKFIPAPGYFFFLAFLAVAIIGGLGLLFAKYRQVKGRQKIQLKFMFLGLLLSSLILTITNVALPNLFNVSTLVTRTGIYSILFFTGFTAYTIIKHRFMDIRLLVARAIAYVFLLTTLAALYTLAAFELTAVFFPNSYFSLQQYLVYVALAIILAFTFQPLRREFERLTDRIFYRDRYDSGEVLNRVSKILASELLLRKLLDRSLEQVCQNLRVEVGQFIILETGKIYHVSHFGQLPDRLITFPELERFNQPILIADELPEGATKATMQRHKIRLALALRTKDVMVGYLLLGEKLSGDIFSNQDLSVLEILASELALAIVNAKAYEEISQFNATLQQKINEATQDLRIANANLKALDRAKDEFISIASHQLRTPLTSIKGYLSMLREGDVDRFSIEQRQFLDFAYGGAERLVSLISDLLNVSRLSAGRFVLDKQPVDLVALTLDEIRQLSSHAQAKGLQLIFNHPRRKLPTIELDESKTRQVIMNFIDNAVYYTPSGSIIITIELDSKAVRLMVKDTGIGVPLAEQKKLFTKFYRAPNAQAIRPDGTGLGLYLAKKVIEEQGGQIIFDSADQQGSTFGFEFPVPLKQLPSRTTRPLVPVVKVKAVEGLTAKRVSRPAKPAAKV